MKSLKKPEPTKLDSRAKKLLHAMWHGVDRDITTQLGRIIPAGTPMSDFHAAHVLGMPNRVLDYWRHRPVFREALREQSNARRNAEEPENLAMAISIRDNNPDDRVKLTAIQTIRVKEPVAAVNVDLSRHDNRQQTLVAPAGYVINLSGKPYAELTEQERKDGTREEK